MLSAGLTSPLLAIASGTDYEAEGGTQEADPQTVQQRSGDLETGGDIGGESSVFAPPITFSPLLLFSLQPNDRLLLRKPPLQSKRRP